MSHARHRASKEHPYRPINAERHAMAIAEAVDEAWYRGGGPVRLEVAVGTVATIAVAGLTARPDTDVATHLRSLPAAEFVTVARYTWAVTLQIRPDLTHLVHPLINWMFEPLDNLVQERAKSVADAALDAGQLELTATDRRFDADLLGPVLGHLKSRTATRVNAQSYTPGDLAVALAAATVDQVEPGRSFCDTTVGTGGLFRAAAQILRSRGHDPATMEWFGADLDELAVAATAVNSLIWGLGPRIVLFAGDVLAHPNWADQAAARRDEVLRAARSLQTSKAALDFLTKLDAQP